MNTLYRGHLKGIWLLAFFVAFMVMPLNQARALYPATVFEDAGVASCNSFFSPGTIVTIFYAYISGPSPEDVASFTATGPSEVVFNLNPVISSRERGLTYIHVENSVVINGSYKFEVTDSLGRKVSINKNFTYNDTIPQVDVLYMIPQHEKYVGTTTPTLSFNPVGSPGQFYYKVYLSGYGDNAFWYMSPITQNTSFTVPAGLLQPDTAYTWYVRVFDSDTDPQNGHQSEKVSFYTGTKALPDLSTRYVASIDCGPNFQSNWFGVSSTNVAPWDKDYLRVTSPDATVYDLNDMLFRFNKPAYYQIMDDRVFPITDGDYDFEIKDHDGHIVTESLNYQHNSLPLIAENSITPANNAYFDTGTLNFRWNPLQGNGTYYYRVRVWDYHNKVIWYDSLPEENISSKSIPVSGNLLRGNSYQWHLIVYDSDTQPNNFTASARRTFTINLKELCEADFEPDGDVDGSDLEVFAGAYAIGDLSADLDKSGVVDSMDLFVFAAEFGRKNCSQSWTQINTDGFGDVNNKEIDSIVEYNNLVYAATVNDVDGTEIWQYNGSTWTQVNTDGFGDSNNMLAGLFVFNSQLYAGTENWTTGAEVWRYDGGSSWTQVNMNGFGDSFNDGLEFTVYNNDLYVVTENFNTGPEVWRYNGGTSWSQVNTDGFGDSNNGEYDESAVYNGFFYVTGENRITGTEVWRYNGGTSWTQVNSDGFGDANNTSSALLVVHNNFLYVATDNDVTGTEVWQYDGSAWTQVNTDGFGDAKNISCYETAIYNNSLHMGTAQGTGAGDTGAEVWRYDGGTSWTQVNTDGFGDANNSSADSIAILNNLLYMGAENQVTGAELWEYNGSTWTQVNSDGFGDADNTSCDLLVVHNTFLYVATDNDVTGAKVWQYSTP